MRALKFTLVAFMAIFMGMNFASCSDDNDEPSVNPEDANGLVGTKWDWANPTGEYRQYMSMEFIDNERCAIEVNYYDVNRFYVVTYAFDEELNMGMVFLPLTEEMVPFELNDNVVKLQDKIYNKNTWTPTKNRDIVGSIWTTTQEGMTVEIEFIDDMRLIQSASIMSTGFMFEYEVSQTGIISLVEGDISMEIDGNKLYFFDPDGNLQVIYTRKK